MNSLKSLKGITSFVAVASSGSFTAAAKLQGVSAVAVSKNIATLERQLDVRLFQRTTRKLSLTREGQLFYRQCESPLRELTAAEASVKQSGRALSGLVRLTCAAPFAMGFIVPLIPQFQLTHPNVEIELQLNDTVSDMVGEGYDVGIRVGMLSTLSDDSRVARVIAPLPFVVCASPSYLARAGTPLTLEDLLNHNCLRWKNTSREGVAPWFLRGLTPNTDKKITGNFIANDLSALQAAAIQGQGLIATPLPLAMPLFRAGQLRPVLTEYIDDRLNVYLHYPNRKNLPARTRHFVDFLLTKLRQENDLQTPFATLIAPYVRAA
jgi:DNA-binding transcriptional LysR family regulator